MCNQQQYTPITRNNRNINLNVIVKDRLKTERTTFKSLQNKTKSTLLYHKQVTSQKNKIGSSLYSQRLGFQTNKPKIRTNKQTTKSRYKQTFAISHLLRLVYIISIILYNSLKSLRNSFAP